MTSSTADKYTTTEYGKQNKFAVNPQPWIDESDKDYDQWKVAESTNGRMAMIGFFALVHNYILFGQVMPGIFLYYRSFTPPVLTSGYFLTL